MLHQAVKKIESKIPDAEVYLFGSYSKGDWIEDSDIDLIVVSDKFQSLNAGERARLVRHLLPLDISFDLILYTKDEFKRARESISMKDVIDSCVRMRAR